MKLRLIPQTLLLIVLAFASQIAMAEIKVGDKLQTLSNLHPDMNKSLLYSTNYQLPSIIPVCENIEVVKFKRNKMIFSWNGRNFTMAYDKHTKKAGVSMQDSLSDFFGPQCDSAKISSLNKADRDGIKSGQPQTGMTKDGILIAMGRPPHHANPNLGASSWMYWLNKFKKKRIDFDANGKVIKIAL